ncbi:hypothetical protein Bmul_0637 [Burkholderia multivorans ATCC 17616]|nr:hypothetical protein Bmul_0637 [Burkholderia multivorans ATCC 17616]
MKGTHASPEYDECSPRVRQRSRCAGPRAARPPGARGCNRYLPAGLARRVARVQFVRAARSRHCLSKSLPRTPTSAADPARIPLQRPYIARRRATRRSRGNARCVGASP